MRIPSIALLAPLLGSCVIGQPATPIGQPGRMHASYALGWKGKESAWRPAEDEFVFGIVDFDAHLRSAPVWIVAKALLGDAGTEPAYVTDPTADTSGTAEFCLGLRKYGSLGEFEPFVSGGVAILYGSVTDYGYNRYYNDSYSIDSETTVGGWVDGGIHLPVTPNFGVGLVVHYSHGSEQNLAGGDVQLGGTSVLLTIGARW